MNSYYREGSHRADLVQRLFSKIAPRYDFINDLQSLGIHRLWKRKLIALTRPQPSHRILDLACGSGDVAFRMLQKCPQAHVMGGDLTFPMLRMAQQRSRRSLYPTLRWIQLDSLALPFRSASIDIVTIAYGLRNVSSPDKALAEMHRVLKPSGTLGILDFGKPPSRTLRKLYFLWLRTFQPLLGRLFFKDAESYRYIYDSLLRYASQEGVTMLLQAQGFKNIRWINLAGGMMSLHLAERI